MTWFSSSSPEIHIHLPRFKGFNEAYTQRSDVASLSTSGGEKFIPTETGNPGKRVTSFVSLNAVLQVNARFSRAEHGSEFNFVAFKSSQHLFDGYRFCPYKVAGIAGHLRHLMRYCRRYRTQTWTICIMMPIIVRWSVLVCCSVGRLNLSVP